MTAQLVNETVNRLVDVTDQFFPSAAVEHVVKTWLFHPGSVLLVFRSENGVLMIRVVRETAELRWFMDAYGE